MPRPVLGRYTPNGNLDRELPDHPPNFEATGMIARHTLVTLDKIAQCFCW
jgi:hypothetical protein